MLVNSIKSIVASTNYYSTKIIDMIWLYIVKLVGRIIYPIHLVLNTKKYVSCSSYYPECELKSKARIFFDQLLYILKKGEINSYYFVCGFDRKQKNDFKNYVPKYYFKKVRDRKNRRPLKPNLDHYDYLCLLRDKLVFESYCKNAGINTPSNNGFIKNGLLFLLKTKSIVALDDIINYSIDAFCKRNGLNYGGWKHNVFHLKVADKSIYFNGRRIGLTELKELISSNNWIIQEKIKNQSFELAKFHPESINTIRIVTINNGPEIDVLGAFIRMGIDENNVDNWAVGGVCVGIDIKDGTLEKYGLFKPAFGTKCDRHPNSGIIFEGYKITKWKSMIEYVKRAHMFFYGLHSIGWDIAVTNDELVIIEGNDSWDTGGMQLYNGLKPRFERFFS